MNFKKIKTILLIFLLVVPILISIIFSNSNNITYKIEAYSKYLYFNWINYPKPAYKLEELPSDVNERLFEWFGYDKSGNPIKEKYMEIRFKYDGNFLITNTYIGIPFYEANIIIYKKIMLKNGKPIMSE